MTGTKLDRRQRELRPGRRVRGVQERPELIQPKSREVCCVKTARDVEVFK